MNRKPVVIFLIIVLLGLLGAALELQTAYASSYTDIDVVTAHNMIMNGSYPDLLVLDVRTQSEYDTGHIYGAVWIPHTELEGRIVELAGHENHEIIVYCRSGVRSVTASEILDSYNFSKIFNMLGGILAWESTDLPIWIATVHNLNTTFNYDTIQEAIDAPETLDGHTILVDEGIYYEHVVIDKAVSLLGEDKDTTVIDGNYSGKVVEINSDNVVINGFSIFSHGKEWHDSGLYLIGNNCTISGNKVITNTTQDSFLIQESLPDAETKIKAIGPPRTYGILLDSSCNNHISDNYVVDRIVWDIHDPMSPISYGVGLIFDSNNNSILNNNMLACSAGGLFLEYRSNDNEIRDNCLVGDGIGVHSYLDCTNNIMSNNYIEGNNRGICIYGSYNESVINNSLINNDYGIWLEYDGGHLVINNDIVDSSVCGINIPQTSQGWYNTVYHNNFVNDSQQVLIYEKSSNIWDDGYPSGGNYWSDYTGVDLDRDGIGDTEYVIDANNTDHYPLMGMFSSFNTSLGYYVNVVSNSTIEDFEYFEFNSTIKMHVSNMTTNQTVGFCRVRIPHALMTEPYNVTVDGANPIYWNYTLYDDGDNRWIYFSYQHSTLEIVIIPEFPSFLVLPLFMTATLLAVIVYKRKHQTRNKKREV